MQIVLSCKARNLDHNSRLGNASVNRKYTTLKNDTVNEDKKFGPEKLNTKDSNKKKNDLLTYITQRCMNQAQFLLLLFKYESIK